MNRFTKGWSKGLDGGLEEAGWFIGATVPIIVVTLFFAAVIGGIIFIRGCAIGPTRPKPCIDYSYNMGVVFSREANCARWPHMEMSVEKRWVKSDVVHCKCTPASYPAEVVK